VGLVVLGGLGLIFLMNKIFLGLIIIIIFFMIGRYLIFKSRRRRGHIHYYGGRI